MTLVNLLQILLMLFHLQYFLMVLIWSIAIDLVVLITSFEKFKTLFPSEKKRKTILKQYKNLKSMAATGLPAEPLGPEDF